MKRDLVCLAACAALIGCSHSAGLGKADGGDAAVSSDGGDAAASPDGGGGGGDGNGPADLAASGSDAAADLGEAVIERNNSPARTGLYIQPTLTKTAAARMARDTSFNGTVVGNVYAQPLYVADGPGGTGVFVVATESNNVTALVETTGTPAWTVNLGAAPANSGAGCGNIHPLGITGTPYIDRASRTLYLDAVLGTGSGTGSVIATHKVHALSLDDGSERAGWPVDLAGVTSGGVSFAPVVQNQRGALGLVGGILYVPFGGHSGDCGSYHGWVMGVPVANPSGKKAWATTSLQAGIWAPGGVATDGTDVFAATGNGQGATWGGQEAIVRLQSGPLFSGLNPDYWAATNWQYLDINDIDIGGTGPLLVDVAGAHLVAAMGKDGYVYLNDRTNLGGIGNAMTSNHLFSGEIINVPATFTTVNGVYVAIHGYMGATGTSCPAGTSGDLVVIKLSAAAPPQISTVWCATSNGQGEPMVTTLDGSAQPIVWWASAEGSNRLYARDGETGALVFGGGVAGDVMAGLHRFSSPIAVKGRILVAGDNKLYAFKPQ
jgi:hypothetical protein